MAYSTIRANSKTPTALTLIFLALLSAGISADQNHLETAREILRRVPLVDGHNDTPWQYRKRVNCNLDRIDLNGDTSKLWPPMHTDMRRLKLGQVGAQFWSVFLPTDQPNAVAAFHNQVRLTHKLIERYEALELATTSDQIVKFHAGGKTASLLGVEGGHALGKGSISELNWLYSNGVRYLTLTHTRSNAVADSSGGPRLHGGLSKQGKVVVKEMNRLGMLIDLSHTSDETAEQTLALSQKPVLFTHSNARGLTDHKRNVPDHILKQLQKNQGVIMLSFVPDFVYAGQGRAELGDVADHFDYVKKLIGVKHIGVGGDFDGIAKGPKGLEDVSKYPHLLAELLKRGWTEEELELVASGNLLRVMVENEK